MLKKSEIEKIVNSFSLVIFLVIIFSLFKSLEYFTNRNCIVTYGTCITDCLSEEDPGKKQDCYIKCSSEKDTCELGDPNKTLYQGSMGNRILSQDQADNAFKQQVTAEAKLVGNNKVCWGEKCLTIDNSNKNTPSPQTVQSGQGTQTGQNNQGNLGNQGTHSNHDQIKNELNKCNQKLNLMKQLLLVDNN